MPLPDAKRRRRRWPIIAFALAMVFLTAFLALPRFLSSAGMRRWMIAKVNEKLAPSGSLEFERAGFSWFGSTVISGLSVKDEAGEIVLKAPRVYWKRSLVGLLLGGQRYGTITIREPVLDVERKVDGTIDILEALGPLIKPTPATDVSVALQDGSLTFRTSELRKPLEAKRLNLTIHHAPKPGLLSYSLEMFGSKEGEKPSLHITGTADLWGVPEGSPFDLAADIESVAWPLQFEAAGVVTEVACAGEMNVTRDDGLWASSGDYRLEQLTTSSPVLGDNQLEDFSGAWDLAQTPKSWKVNRLDLTSPFGTVKAKPAEVADQRVELEGDLDLAAIVSVLKLPLPGDLKLDSARAQVTLLAQWEEDAAAGERKRPSIRTISERSPADTKVSKVFDATNLKLDLSSQLTAQQWSRGDHQFEVPRMNLSAKAIYDEQGLDLESLDLTGQDQSQFAAHLEGGHRTVGEDEFLEISVLDIQAKDLEVHLAGRVKEAIEKLVAEVDRLQVKTPSWNTTLRGSLAGKFQEKDGQSVMEFERIEVESDDPEIQAVMAGRLSGLPEKPVAEVDSLTLSSPRFGAQLTARSEGLLEKVSAELTSLELKEPRLKANLTGSLLGGLQDWETAPAFRVDELTVEKAAGESEHPFRAVFKGLLRDLTGTPSADIEQLDLSASDLTATMRGSVTGLGEQTSVSIDSLDLKRGDASAHIEGRLDDVTEMIAGEFGVVDVQRGQFHAKMEAKLRGKVVGLDSDSPLIEIEELSLDSTDGDLNASMVGRVKDFLDDPVVEIDLLKGQSPDASGELVGTVRDLYGRGLAEITRLDFKAPDFTSHIKGSVSNLYETPLADLEGEIEPDWRSLQERFAEYSEPNASLSGENAVFHFKGPVPTTTPVSAEEVLTTSDFDLSWPIQHVDVFGLVLGPVRLGVKGSQGAIEVDPIETSLNRGRIALYPQVFRDSPGVWTLRLKEGSRIENAEINEEVSHRFLAYVVPLLDEATRVSGRVSATVRRAEFPLEDPEGAERGIDVEGEVNFVDVRFTAGPLMQPIQRTLAQLNVGIPQEVILNQPVKLRIEDSRVYQDGLEVPLGPVSIEMAGYVGFDETLHMDLAVPIKPSQIGPLPPIVGGLVGNIKPVFKVRGTLSKPEIDMSALGESMRDMGLGIGGRAIGGGLEMLRDLIPPPGPR